MNAVLNNETLWVAGGTNIKYSNDGITWIPVVSGPTSVNSLAWTGSQWIAACDGSNNLYVSNNAIQWYQNSSLSAYNIYKIAYNHNTIFALSDSNVYYSKYSNINPNTWSSHYDASLGQITDYSYTGSHHMFVSGSYVLMTQDLVVWSKVVKPSSGSYLTTTSCNQGSATIAPMCIACADSSLNTILYSGDGLKWHGVGTSVLSKANAVEWNGAFWLVVGTSSSTWFALSRDGIHWLKQYDSTLDEGTSIAWNGVLWLASGTKSGLPALIKSADGVTWSPINTILLNDVPYIVWNGYKWIINDGINVYSSANATLWTQEAIAGGDISGASIQSFTESSNGPATGAFNSSGWSSAATYDASGSNPLGEWLQVNMGSSIQLNHYSLESNAATFTLYGSSDASGWTSLDTQSFANTGANNILLTFINTTAYQYYKLLVTRVISGTTLTIKNLAFYTSVFGPQRAPLVYKSWTAAFTNVGYIQYLGIPSAYLNGRGLQTIGPIITSYAYNGQYSLITDASSAYYSTIDFSFNPASTSMASIHASAFNGTYFIVGGSTLKYAHPSDLSTWYSTYNGDTLLGAGGAVVALKSNTGLGFEALPNTLYLNPGEKLSIVSPKFYDKTMEKRGATFMFSLQ